MGLIASVSATQLCSRCAGAHTSWLQSETKAASLCTGILWMSLQTSFPGPGHPDEAVARGRGARTACRRALMAVVVGALSGGVPLCTDSRKTPKGRQQGLTRHSPLGG